MNFLQNRPRKLMATAALSVPLLAAGSTVVFSTAASASVSCNKPDHSCGGQPTGTADGPGPDLHLHAHDPAAHHGPADHSAGQPDPERGPDHDHGRADGASGPGLGHPGGDQQPVRGCAPGRWRRHRWWR